MELIELDQASVIYITAICPSVTLTRSTVGMALRKQERGEEDAAVTLT